MTTTAPVEYRYSPRSFGDGAQGCLRAAFAFSGPLKTYVYIDGFNLYYGCLHGTAYKWLDPVALARIVLPKAAEIAHVRYFTAIVSDRGVKRGTKQRQQTYLRALTTLPNLTIHFGSFLSHAQNMPLEAPQPGGPRTARVIRTEEKGSDVNIAAFMLMDGVEGLYEQAALISNDSDLKVAVEMVRQKLRKPVALLAPISNPRRRLSQQLHAAASYTRAIRKGALPRSQLPPTLTDEHGTIHKPPEW